MDKRTVYGYFYGKPLCFDGCVTEKCRTWPHGNLCGECKEYALFNPQDLAALETENTELKSACGLREGALRGAEHCLANFPFTQEDILSSLSEEVWQSNLVTIRAALSLTPEAVRREAEEARVGRAVAEWQKREAAVMQTMASKGWREAIDTLGRVIAQAREGKQG